MLNDGLDRCDDLLADAGRQRGADDDHAIGVGIDGDTSAVVLALVTVFVGFGPCQVFRDSGGEPVGVAAVGKFEQFRLVLAISPTSKNPSLRLRQIVRRERVID